ncbi:MFS transporter [Streptomyces silvensis]|uniref:MFS transporter n=1 Tax=Streptomyces silvensis TaxID=1765722 RepID=UPI00099F0705|nr:MFS transporter [Streptomyces silvensis]
MTAPSPPVPPGSAADSGRDRTGEPRQWWTVSVAVLAQTLVLLDHTILNIALETLAEPGAGLGASPAELAWAVASYSLVFAACGFPGGALADRFGARRVLVAGLLVLGAAALAAAFAPNAAALIVARGGMGAGGALITPATLALVTRHTTAAARPRALAVWASSGAVAVALGPLVGGALLEHFWWGSVFLLNLPVVAVCLAGAGLLVPRTRQVERRGLDLPGLALSVAGLGLLVYGAVRGGGRAGWSDPGTLVALAAGLVLLALFTVVERARAEPGLDVRLFAEPRFACGGLVLLLLFFGLAGQLFYCAFYLQGVRGLSAQGAGAVMMSAAGGIVLGNQVSPALTRTLTVRWVTAAGTVLAGLTFGGYVFLDGDSPPVWLVLLLFAQGAGVGLVVAPMTTEMMAAIPPHQTGAGAAVAAAARPVGSALGVAVLGSVLAASYRRAVRPALDGLPGTARERAMDSAEAARSLAGMPGGADLLAAADRAYLHAMHVTAVWTALLTLGGAVLVVAHLRPRESRYEAHHGHGTAPPAGRARRR